MVSWESMSANGYKPQGNGVGVTFHGEQGSLMIDGDGYTVYDLKGTVVEDVKSDQGGHQSGRAVGAAGRLHTANFLDGIRGKATSSRQSPAATSAR